jgi:hypothetical protein
MPNQKADDRTRVSYLEDFEVEKTLQDLAARTHCSIASLIREATYKYVAAHKDGSDVQFTQKPKRKPRKNRKPPEESA